MGILLIILIILAVLSLGGGLFISGLKVLLWVALALAVLAVLSWAIPTIRGRSRRGIER